MSRQRKVNGVKGRSYRVSMVERQSSALSDPVWYTEVLVFRLGSDGRGVRIVDQATGEEAFDQMVEKWKTCTDDY